MLTPDPFFLSFGTSLIGVILGVVLYRGDYCMVAMLRDLFLIRDTTLLRSYVLYFLVAAALFHLANLLGLLPLFPPHTLDAASLSTLAGGLLFGVGMVLAGGCVVGTLYKMASGNLTNWIAFAGILAGSLLYAEVHPLVKLFTAQTTLSTTVTVAQNNPGLKISILVALLVAGGFLVGLWSRQGHMSVNAYAKGYLQPWKVVLVLAILNVLYYILSGSPFGITTAYAKIGAYLEHVLYPEHVAGLAYFQENSINWLWGDTRVIGGAGPRLDYVSYTQLTLVAGIFSGAFAAALYYGEFKIYGLPPRRQGFSALAGGILLALGARIASGCNVFFFLGGLPLLAWQGLYFAVAAIIGSYLGTKILTRYVIK